METGAEALSDEPLKHSDLPQQTVRVAAHDWFRPINRSDMACQTDFGLADLILDEVGDSGAIDGRPREGRSSCAGSSRPGPLEARENPHHVNTRRREIPAQRQEYRRHFNYPVDYEPAPTLLSREDLDFENPFREEYYPREPFESTRMPRRSSANPYSRNLGHHPTRLDPDYVLSDNRPDFGGRRPFSETRPSQVTFDPSVPFEVGPTQGSRAEYHADSWPSPTLPGPCL